MLEVRKQLLFSPGNLWSGNWFSTALVSSIPLKSQKNCVCSAFQAKIYWDKHFFFNGNSCYLSATCTDKLNGELPRKMKTHRLNKIPAPHGRHCIGKATVSCTSANRITAFKHSTGFTGQYVCPNYSGSTAYQISSTAYSIIGIETDPTYYPGGRFVIVAPNAAPNQVFMQPAWLNGRSHKNFTLNHQDLVNGGKLSFQLTNKMP
jgi:hypothetical protein